MVEEDIKQDILDRYNQSWPDDMEDTTGLIQASKDNFKELVDLLITTIKKKYEEKTQAY